MRRPERQPRRKAVVSRSHGIAWILMLVVDAPFILWGAMAAAWPDHLLGPRGLPILPAGYEGFTGGSWSALVATSPMTAKYAESLFRTYGAYNVAFGVVASAIALTAFRRGERWAWWALLVGNTITLLAAMRYDWTAKAIGPFELSEYLGLALSCLALALTAPFSPTGRALRPATD